MATARWCRAEAPDERSDMVAIARAWRQRSRGITEAGPARSGRVLRFAEGRDDMRTGGWSQPEAARERGPPRGWSVKAYWNVRLSAPRRVVG